MRGNKLLHASIFQRVKANHSKPSLCAQEIRGGGKGALKLAKLVNPALSGGPKVGVFINGGGAVQVGSGGETANALVATVVAELEAQGINRSDIDAEMVAQYIAGRNRSAIEATSS